jgi:hypothetical protein
VSTQLGKEVEVLASSLEEADKDDAESADEETSAVVRVAILSSPTNLFMLEKVMMGKRFVGEALLFDYRVD